MNTSFLEEQVDGISTDIPSSSLGGLGNLTQQENDGLDVLHQAVLRHGLALPLVVLIEDDEDEAHIFRRALWDVGIAVAFMHFKDGSEAINFFSGNGCYSDRERFPLPQLTVLDLHLTRASGLEILEEIRTRPELERLAVVALTGSEDVREIEKARSLEIDGWFNKPHCAKDLVEIVRSLLGRWLPSAI